jgi:hypothetical protein
MFNYLLSLLRVGLSLPLIESHKGVSPPRSHTCPASFERTVLETLHSYGPSCSVTNILLHYGRTNAQCGKRLGFSMCLFVSISNLLGCMVASVRLQSSRKRKCTILSFVPAVAMKPWCGCWTSTSEDHRHNCSALSPAPRKI